MADEGSRGGTRVVVVVAIVGLLSTVVASLASGILTIEAANVQFRNQRDAANEDKRREVYANYQNAVAKVCGFNNDVYSFDTPPSAEEEKAGGRKINAAIVDVINLNGQVQLFAHTKEMREAADLLTKTMVVNLDQICVPNEALLQSVHGLIDAATADLEQ